MGNRRSGLPTIRDLCQELCSFLAVYIPVVEKLFPEEVEVIAALKALQVLVCSVVGQIDAILPIGD